jgi:hypothetical protein
VNPEQPNTSSADASPSDAAAASVGSDQATDEQPSRPLSLIERLFHRGNKDSGPEASTESGDRPESTSSASKTRSLTEEELQRYVQSEADRRDARRNADAKAAERRRLRDTDPFAYAAEERKAEELAQSTGSLEKFVMDVGTEHDRASIDPVVELLPREARERILAMDGAGKGLQGRKLVVSESLKELEKMWKAAGAKDAEDRLRRNPAFRKQVLNESRRGGQEPDFITGTASSTTNGQRVSDLLRDQLGLHRSA